MGAVWYAWGMKMAIIFILASLFIQKVALAEGEALRARAYGERAKKGQIETLIEEYRNSLRPYILTDNQRISLRGSRTGELSNLKITQFLMIPTSIFL